MATIAVTLDASWLGADDLAFTATRGGSTLATQAATLTVLEAEGTLDLSAAAAGRLVITLADADGNIAWRENYELGAGEVLTVVPGIATHGVVAPVIGSVAGWM